MFTFSESRNLLPESYRALAIQLGAFVIYFSVIIISYTCYDKEFKNRKNEIFSQYYEIIFNHSLIKSLLGIFPAACGVIWRNEQIYT